MRLTFNRKPIESGIVAGGFIPDLVQSPPMSGRNRLSYGLLDQVLSSMSNVLVVFAVASVSSVHDFGAFSLILAALTTVMATGRGLLGTPITLLASDPERLRSEARHALGAAIWGGLAASAITLALAVLIDAPPATYILSLAAPFVLVQDTGRYYCISAGRPRRALLSDAIWAVGSAGLLLISWVAPAAIGSAALVGVWTTFAILAMLLILVPLRLSPNLRSLVTWWQTTLRDRLQFGAEAVIGATTSFLVLGIATATIGISATAALRGASSVLGPLNILMSAIPLAFVAELRRRGTDKANEVWRPLRWIAIVMSIFAIGIGMLTYVVPQDWGELILGDSWTVVRPLLPFTAVEYAGLAWLSAASGGMRAQGRSSDLLRLRLIFAGSSIVLGSVAAVVTGSVRMVAVGLAAAAVIAAALARYMLLRERASS